MSRPQDLSTASKESFAPLSDSDFARLTSLIRERTGIFIPPGKKPLLAARLSDRMRALGLASYADYLKHASGDVHGELSRMTDAVCTNETRFFRDAEQFSYIENAVVPGWLNATQKAPRRIRVWSAGCSTGEEAFSIAMLLLDKLPADKGFAIEVLASDISTTALDKARAAHWPAQRMQDVPEAYRQRFFERNAQTGDYEVSPELRNVVRFQKLNLWDWHYPVTGRFDLIFCRNVLIYFDADTRADVTHRLIERMAPEGLLLIGMAESLLSVRDVSLSPPGAGTAQGATTLRPVGPAIYARGQAPRRKPSTRT